MSALPLMTETLVAPATRPRRRRQTGTSPGRYCATLVAAVVATTFLSVLAGGYARVTVMGNRLHRMEAQLASIEQTNRCMAARAALLAEPARITSDAVGLSMVRVEPARTIYLPNSGEASHSTQDVSYDLLNSSSLIR